MYRKNEGRKKITLYKKREIIFFLSGFSMILIRIPNPNKRNVNPIVSEEEPDMKKVYCEHPTTSVKRLLKTVDRPAFFPNDHTAKTKRILITISNTNTARYSSS